MSDKIYKDLKLVMPVLEIPLEPKDLSTLQYSNQSKQEDQNHHGLSITGVRCENCHKYVPSTLRIELPQ